LHQFFYIKLLVLRKRFDLLSKKLFVLLKKRRHCFQGMRQQNQRNLTKAKCDEEYSKCDECVTNQIAKIKKSSKNFDYLVHYFVNVFEAENSQRDIMEIYDSIFAKSNNLSQFPNNFEHLPGFSVISVNKYRHNSVIETKNNIFDPQMNEIIADLEKIVCQTENSKNRNFDEFEY